MTSTLRVSLRAFSRPRKCIRYTQSSSFSQIQHTFSLKEAVDLSSTAYLPQDGNTTDRALVILHGLFGSKRNWSSICKALHRAMPERPIYTLDLRNHGSSPHALPMTYEAMASDVRKFIEDKQLNNVALLGHSMGGKVAMSFALALQNEKAPTKNILTNLIVADIAPSIGSLSPDFVRYISAMQKIEALEPGVIKTRADADKKLQLYEQDISVRQFLLTNLQLPTPSRSASHDTSPEKAKFIVPLDILDRSINALGSFPYEYNEENFVPMTWDGPTLVVKGSKSTYINHKNIPALQAFFPNMRIEELDAGHWVHAEKPNEFRKLLVDFLRS